MGDRPSTLDSDGISARWPHIARFLHVTASGGVDHEVIPWLSIDGHLSPAERAAGNEEWADFFEWRLEQRADELAGDRIRRHLVEKWTDSMAYTCRRCAAWARGTDPGEWVPQRLRRPDLDAEGEAIMNKTIAELDEFEEPAEQLAIAG
ncbi:hypothetical protein [Actinophytocola sp.]|uniref:hypothetical protein n=1 Tax=Actinophytocola sp. TaxID=1872138 RepID=UPI003D6A5B66